MGSCFHCPTSYKKRLGRWRCGKVWLSKNLLSMSTWVCFCCLFLVFSDFQKGLYGMMCCFFQAIASPSLFALLEEASISFVGKKKTRFNLAQCRKLFIVSLVHWRNPLFKSGVLNKEFTQKRGSCKSRFVVTKQWIWSFRCIAQQTSFLLGTRLSPPGG